MNLKKALLITCIATFSNLSIAATSFATANENNFEKAVADKKAFYLDKQVDMNKNLLKLQFDNHELRSKTYDDKFLSRLEILPLTYICSGLGYDAFKNVSNFKDANCAIDKDYAIVPNDYNFAFYKNGQHLFSVKRTYNMDEKQIPVQLLNLELGTMEDLQKFKEVFQLQNQNFVIEIK